MGQRYARTLREWRRLFLAAADAVGQLGFGPTFQRMWNLFLASSACGTSTSPLQSRFPAGDPDVHQLLLERG